MFLDASIIVAILAKEDDAEVLTQAVDNRRGSLFFSQITRYEAILALSRIISSTSTGATVRKVEAVKICAGIVDEFLSFVEAREVTITAEIGNLAIDASLTYGKFVGHKAALNFGDCFSYACAKSQNVGLLYKGNDFKLTDLA